MLVVFTVTTVLIGAGLLSDKDVDGFMDEAMHMREFEHDNVLKLIGICLDPDNRLPLVVLPFMRHGDLLSYMRDERNVSHPNPHLPI